MSKHSQTKQGIWVDPRNPNPNPDKTLKYQTPQKSNIFLDFWQQIQTRN